MDEARSAMEQQMAKEVEKKVAKWVEVAITVLITVGITFAIAVVVFKLVWGWVVPDLFPGAVAEGLITEDLSWLAAVKLAVLVAVLSGFGPSLTEAYKTRA